MTDVAAVLFDLDGVLVDSEPWWDAVRRRFATQHGRTWTAEDHAAVIGPNSLGWARIMRERLGLELPVEAILDAVVTGVVERYRTEPAPTIDGAAATVRRVHEQYPTALASSSHRAIIDAAVDALGIADALDVVISSDEVAHGKPEPDVYLEAARRLGVDPARCLVIEDSLNGVKAGRAAGASVVLVPNASVPPAPEAFGLAHRVLARLVDLDPATDGRAT